jgi:addiction module HigA family antidote
MIANNLTPSAPIHPGEMIRDELEARGITPQCFAERVGVSPSIISEVLNGKRPVTAEYAQRFEAALGIDADVWLNIQAEWDTQMACR